MRFADLDAVTLDAFGTLLDLIDPTPALEQLLRRHELERSREEIAAALAVEMAHYRRRSISGRDETSLTALQKECAGVFLDALEGGAPDNGFAAGYVEALRFEVLPGVRQVLAGLRARGLAVAVISNWDVGLHGHLRALELSPFLDAVITSAGAGAEKPDPAIFAAALGQLGVSPRRALHVGDRPADEQGARAAGLAFVPAPLVEAFAGWT
jgi:HAD superfamily hydrolase (TIGR01509 family)